MDVTHQRFRSLRPFFLGVLALLIITQIVALSPSSLEEAPPARDVDPQVLLAEEVGQPEKTLAGGIPQSRIPEYTVDGFDYVSTQSGKKQWKLYAKKAYLYNAEKLVHAREVVAHLYDTDNKITVVTGKEAKYFMNERDLEVFGDVETTFPDGFKTSSQYLRYQPNTRFISVPTSQPVAGLGAEEDGQWISFTSMGLEFAMDSAVITLPSTVRFVMSRRVKKTDPENPKAPAKEEIEDTVIHSDHCLIYRPKQLAHFTMYPERPLSVRFVRITQPSLFTRSRRADLNYGDFSDKLVNYLTAYEDVLIKEKTDSSLRYGTGGRADFDSKKNVVVLTEFPQVYQDNDTVTGDVIVLHRETDVIEVEHSNAFTAGEPQQTAESEAPSASQTIQEFERQIQETPPDAGSQSQTR